MFNTDLHINNKQAAKIENSCAGKCYGFTDGKIKESREART